MRHTDVPPVLESRSASRGSVAQAQEGGLRARLATDSSPSSSPSPSPPPPARRWACVQRTSSRQKCCRKHWRKAAVRLRRRCGGRRRRRCALSGWRCEAGGGAGCEERGAPGGRRAAPGRCCSALGEVGASDGTAGEVVAAPAATPCGRQHGRRLVRRLLWAAFATGSAMLQGWAQPAFSARRRSLYSKMYPTLRSPCSSPVAPARPAAPHNCTSCATTGTALARPSPTASFGCSTRLARPSPAASRYPACAFLPRSTLCS